MKKNSLDNLRNKVLVDIVKVVKDGIIMMEIKEEVIEEEVKVEVVATDKIMMTRREVIEDKMKEIEDIGKEKTKGDMGMKITREGKVMVIEDRVMAIKDRMMAIEDLVAIKKRIMKTQEEMKEVRDNREEEILSQRNS